MKPDWIFLRLRENNYNNLDFTEKEKIENEVLWMEYFAQEFETKTIISLGSPSLLKVKDDVQEIRNKGNSAKAILVAKKATSSGLAAIKEQLGHKEKN